MSFIPALKSAGLMTRTGSRNALNEWVYTWSEPVPHPVVGWWAGSDEPAVDGVQRSSASGNERVNLDVSLITPTEFPAKPQDRVVLAGKLYEISGWAQDHTNGPWWNPGCVVWSLTRIEGG